MTAICAKPRRWTSKDKRLMMNFSSEDYDIKIRQQPKDALLAQDGKEKSEQKASRRRLAKTDKIRKDRKPVDPPPIIEVNVRQEADPIRCASGI